MGTHAQIVAALCSLRPAATWKLDGTTYSGLTWLDEIQSKPTEQDILDAIE